MEFMLTTIDNPFNPFTHYEDWYNFDTTSGYNTCAYLARITKSSEDLSDLDQELAIDQAMNEIINLNLSGKHIKVTKEFIPRSITIMEE